MLGNSLTQIKSPLSVNLEVTAKCNLSCIFCFNATPVYKEYMRTSTDKHNDASEKLKLLESGVQTSVQEIKKDRIFQIIDRLADAEVFEIRLFGGEFTIYKPWRDILRYAFKKNLFISFVSNGYLIGEEDAKLLSDCGVQDCTISVHGTPEVHDKVTRVDGSFSKAMDAIKVLTENGIIVTVAYTPVTENLSHVYVLVNQLATDHGVKFFSISRLFSDDRYARLGLPDYLNLLDQIERCHKELGVSISLGDSFPRCQVPARYWPYLAYCSQGVSFAQIDFNGNLKHCSATSKPIGNMLTDPLEQLWNEQLQDMRSLMHLPKSCRICPIFCGGGCTVSRGVEHQFAPDEFIPWPKDESWLMATMKSLRSWVRRGYFNWVISKRWKQEAAQAENVKVVESKPHLQSRYRIREEHDGTFTAMIGGVGIKKVTPLGASVIENMTGKNTVDEIATKCAELHGECSSSEVLTILHEVS